MAGDRGRISGHEERENNGRNGMMDEDMTNDQPRKEEMEDRRINTEQGERLIGEIHADLENRKSERPIGETLGYSQTAEEQ